LHRHAHGGQRGNEKVIPMSIGTDGNLLITFGIEMGANL
jgi:hypothetical protein